MANRTTLIATATIVLTGFALSYFLRTGRETPSLVPVKLPVSLSAEESDGLAAFDENCAVCHGRNAAGSNAGPPLVHIVYETGHHGDAAFYRAVSSGVRAHHWQFGNMPPIEGVTRLDVANIIRYVRKMQRTNGIF